MAFTFKNPDFDILVILVVPCNNVPDVGNSKRWPTENSVPCGTKVRYTCNQGLTLEGDALECGVGGQPCMTARTESVAVLDHLCIAV